jgi:hypothetical protein
MPWWVLISAVVHTGSTIFKSECKDTLSVVSALAAGARARLAANAARPSVPARAKRLLRKAMS